MLIDTIYAKAEDLSSLKSDEIFQAQLNKLKHLVQILDEYKPKTKHIELCDDLNKLLLECTKGYKKRAKRKGVKLVINLDPNGCPTMIDGTLLVNTICSLIENALDVSKSGDSIVMTSERKGENCILSVSDEGPGISKENLPKLFTPFFTTKPKGSGLGLSSGQKVLREQGGDLLYEQNSNGGAKFNIVIPHENAEYNLDDFLRSHELRKG